MLVHLAGKAIAYQLGYYAGYAACNVNSPFSDTEVARKVVLGHIDFDLC